MKNEKLSNDYIADKVCEGWFGNGLDRQKRLEDAGYDYNVIQTIVNEKMMTKRMEEIRSKNRNMSNYRILKAMIIECLGSTDISYINMILSLAENIVDDSIAKNGYEDKEN